MIVPSIMFIEHKKYDEVRENDIRNSLRLRGQTLRTEKCVTFYVLSVEKRYKFLVNPNGTVILPTIIIDDSTDHTTCTTNTDRISRTARTTMNDVGNQNGLYVPRDWRQKKKTITTA